MCAWTATAEAHPNIAFIKYWGNRDHEARIPSNGSLSMNLAGLVTRTTVTFRPDLTADRLVLHGREVEGPALARVSKVLSLVRAWSGLTWHADVRSENNFPTGAGIASSASAFAALAVAAAAAAGLDLAPQDLSRLARWGSGSASRSVPGGFVEWLPGTGDEDSYAISIAPPEHWALMDCVALVSTDHKAVGSSQGHRLAEKSPFQAVRVADAPRRLDVCRDAILKRDFEALAEVVELDCHMMHAVMQTSSPRLLYWEPATVTVMQAVRRWRQEGLPVAYTIDAGPNVHVLCPQGAQEEVASRLRALPGVQDVLTAGPGGPARVVA
ncbi:MAG: diphosphomevalonate decarboxylase [Chloroflexi bacterium]|nr:diphosphomevalonate decarboxylase [Chloroflexota bacterium]